MIKKTYTIEVEINKDGKLNVHRRCDGFNSWELLGILENIQLDIMQQMAGQIKPDIIKREYIKASENETPTK